MNIMFETYDKMEKLKNLKPSRYQRNKHPKEQIEIMAKVMEQKGVWHPISVAVIDGKITNEISFGHGRKLSAELNGWDEFPIVYKYFKDDTDYYEAVQADNALADWSELDISKINTDLPEMGPELDIEMLGIKDFVLDVSEKYDLYDKVKNKKETKHILEVEFASESDLIEVYDELLNRGYIVKTKS